MFDPVQIPEGFGVGGGHVGTYIKSFKNSQRVDWPYVK
jgi:hypothetical protein